MGMEEPSVCWGATQSVGKFVQVLSELNDVSNCFGLLGSKWSGKEERAKARV